MANETVIEFELFWNCASGYILSHISLLSKVFSVNQTLKKFIFIPGKPLIHLEDFRSLIDGIAASTSITTLDLSNFYSMDNADFSILKPLAREFFF
ncbi:hypothetical protein GEMRC1_011486 [Eukaryota sp. GEM-RC1]